MYIIAEIDGDDSVHTGRDTLYPTPEAAEADLAGIRKARKRYAILKLKVEKIVKFC